MATPMRRPSLPRLVLWLGGAAPVLIVASLVVAMAGPPVELVSRRASEYVAGAALIGIATGFTAVVAIVTGQVARRRYPHDGHARLGLILAYCTAGGFRLLGVAAVATWLWMMTHYR